MNLISRRLALALVLLSPAAVLSAQTVDEVIAKSVAASGGRAALLKLKSRSMTGTITLSTPGGEIVGSVEILNAAPNKSRSVIKADLSALGAGPLTIDQRFDGTAGYVLDTLQGNRDITGGQLDNLRNGSFPSSFLTYKEMGISAKLGDKQKVGERDAFVVIFEPPAGSVVRQYIDAENLPSGQDDRQGRRPAARSRSGADNGLVGLSGSGRRQDAVPAEGVVCGAELHHRDHQGRTQRAD